MRLEKILAFFTVIGACFILFFSSFAIASIEDYPKTLEERQAEQMGSILGEDGITFSSKKSKEDYSKKSHDPTNKYMLQATLDVLSFAPLAMKDDSSGLIATEWYMASEQDKQSEKGIKITVRLNSSSETSNALEVKVFEGKLFNQNWASIGRNKDLEAEFKDKILRRARELSLNQ
jgi:hypothetical protein